MRIVIGISGASGIILGCKVVQTLLLLGHDVDLVVSAHAAYTAKEEMGEAYSSVKKIYSTFECKDRLRLHGLYDFAAPIASGSYHVDACGIVPCSMATLAAIRIGLGDNLLRRVADVALKERRRLVLVPREMPFSEIHLENMLMLSRAGAVIMPPQPAWYTRPVSIEDIEKNIVGRIIDMLGVPGCTYDRWTGSTNTKGL